MSRPRETTDAQLLEAARACFLERGPRVSTQVVAQAAGVSQATLFKRFGTKEELLLAAMRPQEPVIIRQLDLERPAREQLEALLSEMTAFFFSMLPRLAVLKAAGVEPGCLFRDEEPPPIRARRLLTAWLAELHAAGRVRVPDPGSVALALIGSVSTPAMRAFLFGEEPPDPSTYAASVVDLFWEGMKP